MSTVELMDDAREEILAMCKGRYEAESSRTAGKWKHIEQDRPSLVQDEKRMALLVIKESVEDVSLMGREGEIAFRLVHIFKRHTMTLFIGLCQETVESLWVLLWMEIYKDGVCEICICTGWVHYGTCGPQQGWYLYQGDRVPETGAAGFIKVEFG